MRRFAVLSVVLAACLFAAPWSATADDWVRGAVTAVGADSITVKASGQDWTFKVDKDTDVIVKGGTTATKAAMTKGTAGPTLAELVKVGDGVEVHYKDAAGAKLATAIRGGISLPKEKPAGAAEEKAEGKSARGTVSAVGADSLTIMSGGAEMKFMVDAKTRVEGTGIGTAGKELEKAGKPVTLANLLAAKDEVIVYYMQSGTMMHATEVRVTRKIK